MFHQPHSPFPILWKKKKQLLIIMKRRKWCIKVRLDAVSTLQLRISPCRNAQLMRFRAICPTQRIYCRWTRHVAAMAGKGTDPPLVNTRLSCWGRTLQSIHDSELNYFSCKWAVLVQLHWMLGAREKLIVKRCINASAEGKFGRIRRFWEKYYYRCSLFIQTDLYMCCKKKK